MLPRLVALVVLATAGSGTQARPFNITHLIVPDVVPPGQAEVDIECRYDANFTLLSWFKGHNEFFRYKPGAAPSTRSFPVLGIGRIEMVSCGPTACRLRLGGLTEDATGLYRCDIERDVPPYKFETRTARMEIRGHEHRRPLLEGLAEEYGEGDFIQAYCRGEPDAEIRWYVNGKEDEEMRGSAAYKRHATRFYFIGLPPTITMQCAEFIFGKLAGSKESKARWREMAHIRREDHVEHHKNGSNVFRYHLSFMCILSLISYF
ncbi:uncharacterized protein LOC115452438 [Manduca sexta]|uniref:Ig-like domain-containing protein n=1 Tax=Manduca sexta TaxID=7130 RepID=A0A922D036_MANSE|nr:uncharacterized protein LOC115452438 [Manduca sexta]KAG6463518.1 hypothetical protein O3G_MSEX013912 [Manduca sexta]